MAENLEIKVSYVRITQYGLESHKDESLMNLNYEDRKDIKVMSFLPVKYDGVLDVSEYLDGFAILETLNLPSMMTTTMKQAKEKCPMLKEIVLISRNTFEQSLDSSAVRITAKELEGDNDAILSCYSTIDKEGMQTIVVNPVHIDNHEIVMEDKVLERLSMEHVDEYVSGERGLIKLIEEVNATIEDPRCHIEIGEDMLENLLYLFVEKGLTFEQFAIDFSKLYDKIESYKSISRTINQVSIKEEVESCIIETYQELQEVLYKGMLSDNAQKLSKLVSNVDIKAQDALVSDLSRYLVNLIVVSPRFDENYQSGDTVDQILNDMIISMTKCVKSSKNRDLLKKNLTKAVTKLKSDKQGLYARIDKCLSDRVSIDWLRESFAEKFGLDLGKKQSRNLVRNFIDILVNKNLFKLVKEDVLEIMSRVQNEIGNGEVRSKELINIIKGVVDNFPTREEINDALVEIISKNGYFVVNNSDA